MRDTALENRILEVAQYIADNNATVRMAAAYFGLSKTIIHRDIHLRLKDLDSNLESEVLGVLAINQSQRHIRGGESTRARYARRRPGEVTASVNTKKRIR